MKLFIRHQVRQNQWYIVNGYTPIRLAGYPMFFTTKDAALMAVATRGWVLKETSTEELVQVEREIAL